MLVMSDIKKQLQQDNEHRGGGTICSDIKMLLTRNERTYLISISNQARTLPGHISASRLFSTMNTYIFLSAVKIPYPLSLSVLIYSLYVSDEILNKCFLIAA